MSKRLKLCEHAVNLAERLDIMNGLELHQSLGVIHNEGVDLPMPMKVKLILRQCMECSENCMDKFLVMWSPWRESKDDDPDGGEFNPLQPRIRPLIDIAADKALKLQMAMDEASDGEEGDRSEHKAAKEDLVMDWKAWSPLPVPNL